MRKILVAFVCLCAHAERQSIPTWQRIHGDLPQNAIQLDRWTLQSTDGAIGPIQAHVPGDLWSDLLRAGLIDDPYKNMNFLSQRHVWMGNTSLVDDYREVGHRKWLYTTEVECPAATFASKVTTNLLLAFNSAKMGAIIIWNGEEIGTVTNQFRRSVFHLPCDSSVTQELSILFDPSIDTHGRFMACSGGWDWAPYTRIADRRGSGTGTLGMVGPAFVLPVQKYYIEQVVVHINNPVRHSIEVRNFTATVCAYVVTLEPLDKQEVHLEVKSQFSEPFTVTVETKDNKFPHVACVDVKAHDVDLWLPNGMGSQPLYSISVRIKDDSIDYPWQLFKVGFRSLSLVTALDVPLWDREKEGSGSHGMHFCINGQVVYCKGANIVPIDMLEGRASDEVYVSMVESVKKAGMNMIRIWGGGSIPPDSFYDACDEHGVLIYHDMMFVGEQNHSAYYNVGVEDEVRSITRRLMHHPSIVLWSGCNECTYMGGNMSVYEEVVLQTVAAEDSNRPVWPSSPAQYGWDSGVFTSTGLPSSSPLRIRSKGEHFLEVHGPYHRGFSMTYPGVNGQPEDFGFTTNVPPVFHFDPQYQYGVDFPSTFVSEFGSSTLSSFESMAPCFEQMDYSLHGGEEPSRCNHVIGDINFCSGDNVMAERNYPCDNKLNVFFGISSQQMSRVGEETYRMHLYLCMIAQALWMKGEIEMQRSRNSYGSLIWQLNEIWPSGGWGVLEYSATSGSQGEVVGGRWKPLMHLLHQHLLVDVVAACGREGLCFIKSDALVSVKVQLTIQSWKLSEDLPLSTTTIQRELSPKAPLIHFSLPLEWNASDVYLLSGEYSTLDIQKIKNLETSAFLWKAPQELAAQSKMQPLSIRCVVSDTSGSIARLVLTSSDLALYVMLSTATLGHFDRNAVHLVPNESQVVEFSSSAPINWSLFLSTLHVHHLMEFAVPHTLLVEFHGDHSLLQNESTHVFTRTYATGVTS